MYYLTQKIVRFQIITKIALLNYAHIGWASTNKIKLKNLYNQQKHALRIIFHKDKLDSVTYLFN